jgi:hypothetical protein
MTVQDVKPLIFPELYDPDIEDTPILESIDWKGADLFIVGTFPVYQIIPKSNDTDYGDFNITITVRDDNP